MSRPRSRKHNCNEARSFTRHIIANQQTLDITVLSIILIQCRYTGANHRSNSRSSGFGTNTSYQYRSEAHVSDARIVPS